MAPFDFATFLQTSITNPSYAPNSQQALPPQHARHPQARGHQVPCLAADRFDSSAHMNRTISQEYVGTSSSAMSGNGYSKTMAPEFGNLYGNFASFSDAGYALNGGEPASRMSDFNPAYPFNFRAAESSNGSFNDPALLSLDSSGMVRKVDNSEHLPALTVLPHQVDSSRYEYVDDEAWMLSSVEYDADSPASFDTQSSGPYTPTTPILGNSFFTSFSGSATSNEPIGQVKSLTLTQPYMQYPRNINSLSLQGRPLPLIAGLSSVERAPSSSVWNVVPQQSNDVGLFNNHTHAHGLSVPCSMTEEPRSTSMSGNITSRSLQSSVQSEMETSPEPSDSDFETEMDVNEKSTAETGVVNRRDRDNYLLDMRKKCHSYKEIKRLGGFQEAESTLRGRVRVLTKCKNDRVRKPEWKTKDLQLLRRAMSCFGVTGCVEEQHESRKRVPWKKVSEWMSAEGSSYLFAPATCAKKWRNMN